MIPSFKPIFFSRTMQFVFLVVVVNSLVLVLLLLVVVEIGEMNEACYALEIILPSIGSRLVFFLPLGSTSPDFFRAGDQNKCYMSFRQTGFVCCSVESGVHRGTTEGKKKRKKCSTMMYVSMTWP